MKISVCLFVYNERKYLPAFLDYYRRQGCDFIIIDNMSNDGTYEYLVKEKVNVSRLDTGGAFQLRLLQDALMKEIAKVKPDWVVYTGADLYYSFVKSIRETIMELHIAGYNQMKVQLASAMNTGEKMKKTLQNTYFYGIIQKDLIMISKYTDGFYIVADSIQLKAPKVRKVEGLVINYGACKPIREQRIKLQRRQKAWDEGMHKGWGTHYIEHEKRKWIWRKDELVYFPNTEIWKYIQKIMVK
jgi:glycosyltransferase involved in cell wall biosynthesis